MIELPRYAATGIQGPDIKHIRKDRLGLFLETENYRDVNLNKFLEFDRTDDVQYISLETYSVPRLERPLFAWVKENAVWRAARKGESFGPSWATHWFKLTITSVPKHWVHLDGPVVLEFDLAEGLIYDSDGKALQGLTGSGPDGGSTRTEWIVPDHTRFPLTIFIEQACNGLFGNGFNGMLQAPSDDRYFTLNKVDLLVPDLDARALRHDFEVLRECASRLQQDAFDSQQALEVANKVMDAFDQDDRSSILKCRQIAQEYLGSQVDGPQVFDQKNCNKSPQVFAVGNTHIDTAWLWPYAETRRKIARSWSTQLDLLQRYPESRFTASQAQQFLWLEEDHPELFRRVQEAVKAGGFETIGGMWVESDTNLPSGESLCRQLLLGQRYFKEKFGVHSTVFWLPDTFGYAAAIPQLARLADMRFFMTQKLSWNNINNFPATTFRWVGLDGSQLLCHMPPTDTYTAELTLDEVLRSETKHKNLGDAPAALLAYGFGDGGGGPRDDMLERARRIRGAADTGARSLPQVVPSTVTNFFHALESQSQGGTTLTAWNGPLYLEFHRGTLTTHARIKAHNVQSEHLLHDLEWYSAAAALQDSSFTYPHQAIRELWHDVLLNQFHDILPGSAIELAYVEAEELFSRVFKRGERLLKEAQAHLKVDHVACGKVQVEDIGKLFDAQPVSWPRVGTIETLDGSRVVAVDSCGALKAIGSVADATVKEAADGSLLASNAKWSLNVKEGLITSLFDKVGGRELLEAPINFALFEDEPLQWQAWDVELTYLLKKPRVLRGESKVLSQDPHQVVIRTQYQISKVSSMTVDLALGASDADGDGVWSCLEFRCKVDWKENKRMLRCIVPTRLLSQKYTVGTQFGNLEHPTHANTSWDEAKFETCHHGYIDLSEGNLGLTLLTVDKFGSRVLGRDISLALLRSPKAPDAHADMHEHEFRFALGLHRAAFSQSNVTAKALSFGRPIRPVKPNQTLVQHKIRPITLRGHNSTFISALKVAEDSNDLIVRLFEGEGASGPVEITSHVGSIRTATIVNLLEHDLDSKERLHLTSETVKIRCLRAFEVLTVRIRF